MINSCYISYERKEQIMKKNGKEAGVIMQREVNKEFILPKNIRQMGAFGDTYKVYVEDFVYTYVHQFIHRRKKEDLVLAAVLLGKTVCQGEQEYVFISGAQKVEFHMTEDSEQEETQEESEKDNTFVQDDAVSGERNGMPRGKDAVFSRQQEFWNKVYQRIKQYFDDCEILGWYFNLDGSNLEINAQLQQFFESTYKKGSRFLYYEDSLEQEDAFFVQEQHRLQRLSGYAVYYEKNPRMQEFMIAEKERLTPKPLRDSYVRESRDEVVQSYRAIMNKLNEKPQKKKLQPVIYVAGMAVLAVVVATGVSQIGNYQNLKILEQTMQTLSGAVGEAAEEEEQASEAESANESEAEGTDSEKEDGEETNTVSSEQTLTDTETSSGSTDSQTTTDEEESSASEETQQEDSSQQTAATPSDYYIVKKGDSLVSISKAIYNTSEKVEEICQMNDIENMDMIYEGQKLLLP